MRSKSIDPAFIHHNDTVCILHTGDTLGDDQLGCIRNLFSERSADFCICSCIYALVLSSRIRIFGFFRIAWQYRVSASVHRIH